jgi:hypothetical protein
MARRAPRLHESHRDLVFEVRIGAVVLTETGDDKRAAVAELGAAACADLAAVLERELPLARVSFVAAPAIPDGY